MTNQDSKQSYEDKVKILMNIENKYDLDSWYFNLSEFTVDAKFVPITIAQGKILRRYYRFKHCKAKELSELEIQILQSLSQTCQQMFDCFESKCFIRLCTKSPKDSILDFIQDEQKTQQVVHNLTKFIDKNIANKKELKLRFKNIFNLEYNKPDQYQKLNSQQLVACLTTHELNQILVFLFDYLKQFLQISFGNDGVELLTNSEKINRDLHNLLTWKGSDVEADINENECKVLLTQFAIRPWKNIPDKNEFRCFYYDKKLTAISQYNYHIFIPEFQDEDYRDNIKVNILKFFLKFRDRLNEPNGVIDVYFDAQKQWHIIDINPFNDYPGSETGSSLFSWEKDMEILKNGPLQIKVVTQPNSQIYQSILPFFNADQVLEQSLVSIYTGDIKKDCQIF